MSLRQDSLSGIDVSRYNCIVIGASAGGFKVICNLLEAIPESCPSAILLVSHIHPSAGNSRIEYFNTLCSLNVVPAEDKEPVRSSTIYVAPPDYHLMVDEDFTFSLSVDEKVNFSRPSIDVLFESAARAYREKLVSIILTGANDDGAAGTEMVRQLGGLTIAQDPMEAEFRDMPQAAIDTGTVSCVSSLKEIADFLRNGRPDSSEGTF